MKKILYLQGHARYTREWGILGEIIKTLEENPENEVYYLDCNNTFKGYCWLTKNYHWGYCHKCLNGCRRVLKYLNFDQNRILKIKKVKVPKFPNFNSIEDLLNYEYEGYHIAFGAVNCLMTALRDYKFDVKKYRKILNEFIKVEYTTLKNIEELYEKFHFDEIHTFNGRFSLNHPLIEFAQKKEIPFVLYEFGSKIDKYRVDRNNVIHDFYYIKRLMQEYWRNAPDNRNEVAEKWFNERRKGKFQAMQSFTKDQIKNLLPKDFDTTKENIAIFNSSTDEIACFKSWKHPFFETDNDITRAVLEHYKDDHSKHFYLRVHPNLTSAKKNMTTQIKEIYELKKKYKNLTVIEPDEKVDTYALLDAADKVLTCGSSVGCEATYWNNVSILAGKTQYEDDGCTYNATSFEELFELIDSKVLKPKPKETTYPFGYFNEVYGVKYKYFRINDLKNGEFGELKIEG